MWGQGQYSGGPMAQQAPGLPAPPSVQVSGWKEKWEKGELSYYGISKLRFDASISANEHNLDYSSVSFPIHLSRFDLTICIGEIDVDQLINLSLLMLITLASPGCDDLRARFVRQRSG